MNDIRRLWLRASSSIQKKSTRLKGQRRGMRELSHVFGLPLVQVTEHIPDCEPQVPDVLRKCILYIEEHGRHRPFLRFLFRCFGRCASQISSKACSSSCVFVSSCFSASLKIFFLENHLLAIGLQHEGLYRLAGQQSRVMHLKEMFDQGLPVDLEMEHGEALPDDINIVAGLLKLYLRELPEPLILDSVLHGIEMGLFCGLTSIQKERRGG